MADARKLGQKELMLLLRKAFSKLKGGHDESLPVCDFIPKDGIRFKSSINDYDADIKPEKWQLVITSIDGKTLNQDLHTHLSKISKNSGGWPVLAQIADENCNRVVMLGLKKVKGITSWHITEFNPIVFKHFDEITFPEPGQKNIVHEILLSAKAKRKIKQTRAHTPDNTSQQPEEVKSLLARINEYNNEHPDSGQVAGLDISGGAGLSVQGMLSSYDDNKATKAESPIEKDKLFCKSGEVIQSEGASECFGFSLLAYSKLREVLPPETRIRLVSDGTHNMVLVGYNGDSNPIHIQDLIDNQDDILIVDLWALSMGHKSIYENSDFVDSHGVYLINNYPLRMNFLSGDLIVNFDSKTILDELQKSSTRSESKENFLKARRQHGLYKSNDFTTAYDLDLSIGAANPPSLNSTLQVHILSETNGVLDGITLSYHDHSGGKKSLSISPKSLRSDITKLSVREFKEFRKKLLNAKSNDEMEKLLNPYKAEINKFISNYKSDKRRQKKL